ncbi:MAG: protein-L-isoaspartate(D-aspartate) O-methyltransferase, partial [Actinomycetota bacterium]|nr:protein-L-isoaspartate(D-aspartate) O-methyltransferase [Actinomycetota bacterium]
MDADELIRGLSRRIRDKRVLAAIAAVRRERFVRPDLAEYAYQDTPLPIGGGQTISQPTVVARMCEILDLKPSDRVLDVGTGSGYHAAVMARLCAHVWGIERDPELQGAAERALQAAGVENVTVVVGDGHRGLPDEAPFDAINVAAAARDAVPAALEEQLAEGGRLVAPVVRDDDERLVLVRRTAEG